MPDEANAVNETAEMDAATTDSAPVEQEQSDSSDAFDKALNGESVETQDQSSDDSTDDEDVDETQEEQKPVNPKSENRYQKLANDNKALRDEVEALRARQAQFAQEQELLDQVNPDTGEFYTPEEVARIARFNTNQAEIARMQQQEVQLRTEMSLSEIRNDAEQALKDFPMFDETSPEFNQDLYNQVEPLLQAAIIRDQNGNFAGYHYLPSTVLKTVADSISFGKTQGQVMRQRSQDSMRGNADVIGGGTTQKTSKDPILEALNSNL